MNYKRLFISLVVPQLAGVIGSIFTTSAIPTWYATLAKPWFTPPNWLFGPVWLVLYVLMGIAVYRIWIKSEINKKAGVAVSIFWVHLFFNMLWSIVFFGFKEIGLAFIIITFVWFFIAGLIMLFQEIDKKAAWLLVPYLSWVSFASVLNFGIFLLN